jgi:hypothetical protein
MYGSAVHNNETLHKETFYTQNSTQVRKLKTTSAGATRLFVGLEICTIKASLMKVRLFSSFLGKGRVYPTNL